MASKLDHALTMETRVLALIVVDRESMRWALDEPPTDALAELRGVLLSTRGGYAKGWSETSARARRAAEALGVVLRDNSFEAEVAHSREERLT